MTFFNYDTVVIEPAHDRERATVEEVRQDFFDGRDFRVIGEDNRFFGKIVNKNKLRSYHKIEIRFDNRTLKTVIYKK